MIGGYEKSIPPVTKNLIIINVLFFIASYVFESTKMVSLSLELGAFYPDSNLFKPWQVMTHMFMHGSLIHLFLNVYFGLYMFGAIIEQELGSKQYLIFYFICGLGGYFLYNIAHYFEVQHLINQIVEINPDFNIINDIKSIEFGMQYDISKLPPTASESTVEMYKNMNELIRIYNVPAVGASGALFGVIIAFGLLFPEATIYLMFAIPVKGKHLAPILILGSLFFGIGKIQGDNIAHFAHLGGAVLGYIYCRFIKQNRFRIN